MTRTLPPLKLQKSPLVMVLAQVRFSAVLKMADFVPELQERLRHAGFPRLSASFTPSAVIGPQGMKIKSQPRWEFQNREQTVGLVLGTGALILQTNEYATFEDFVESLTVGVEAVADIVKPGVVERTGLRYVDRIRPSENETWQDYLKDGLHGLDPAAIGMIGALHRAELIGKTEHGTLVVRVMQSNGDSFLPPDLSPSSLKYAQQPNQAIETMLDLDHYSEDEISFNTEEIVKRFGELHDALDRSFRAATTEHAMKAWQANKR